MIDLISGLIEIVFGFVAFILALFAYLFSTGEEKRQAKEDLKELSKSFLIPFVVVFGIASIFFINRVFLPIPRKRGIRQNVPIQH
ncbi:fucose 4-O-acetylase [Bacillus thuringiensis]|nr:fucose 4-O-acetylase [Bacillus thuringiensis]MED3632943.1 fucose 4-O-acetylase [Bacillus thuringiensis]